MIKTNLNNINLSKETFTKGRDSVYVSQEQDFINPLSGPIVSFTKIKTHVSQLLRANENY